MDFDITKDVPAGHELAGMGPIPPSELEKVRQLQKIRADALRRYQEMTLEMHERSMDLQRQFIQADKALDGRLIELTWVFGWEKVSGMAVDEDKGMLYGFKLKPRTLESIMQQMGQGDGSIP